MQTIEELASDAQLIQNDIIRQVQNGSDTKSFTVDSPMKIQEEIKVQPGLAPGLGQHTIEVLAELGYDSAQIDALGADGVIPQPKKVA